MKRFAAGFAILFKYKPDGDMAAEHDEVYVAGPEPEKLTEEERKILDDNGWSWDGSCDSWHKFV